MSDPTLVRLLGLVLMSAPPLFIASYFIRVDARARAYVDTTKAKLLLIEKEWKTLFPANHFTTYEQQFEVLVHHKGEVVDKYLGVRNLNADPYSIDTCDAAHVGEETILRLFWWLWMILVSIALCSAYWYSASALLCKT